ncbi:hypothetical protein IWQ60_008888 [Tieghemiomyces parasiticus]|uniref:Uncharacterized protein n=1 Tax=Tieghemiomyces parasiticus TaxID=78921 RepID=A0A9W7ZW06_9FUNG|nr:hypothetical protein IWQ60_008888 [Tieghemiomyces parasiticus]
MPIDQQEKFVDAFNIRNTAVASLMPSYRELESHDKDIASRTEPWFKEWISHESPPDYVGRTRFEKTNDRLAWPRNNIVVGENNERRQQRLLDQDYQILRNTYLDEEVRDKYITEIRKYMHDTIWPVAKPLVEATLYRRLLVGILHEFNVTPLGNVYANDQEPPYLSYPLPSEENVRGVTIVGNEDVAAYDLAVEGQIDDASFKAFLPGAIRDFRPELLKINKAARPIKFDDVLDHKTRADLALRFPQALLLGNVRYLDHLQQVLFGYLGTYGVMDIFHQGSAIPTGHIQFMEIIFSGLPDEDDEDDNIDVIASATTGAQAPSLAQVTSIMQDSVYRRTFRATGRFYQKEVEKVFRHSVVVAFAALGMLDHLDAYIARRISDNVLVSYRDDERRIAILVADRLKQPDHVNKIQSWYEVMSDAEACYLKGSGLYLGWEPRTDTLKDLVQRCDESKPAREFENDLPVYIGADDKLYFLTYDSMVTTEPTTLQ